MKNYVRLCRPRFDVTLLEVEADEVEAAEIQALAKAIEGDIPESAWLAGIETAEGLPRLARNVRARCVP